MNRSARLVVMLLVLAAAVVLLIPRLQKMYDDPHILPIDDFVEYWAAGKLNAAGRDPYLPENLLPLQQDAGRDTDVAIMMWNPPWTLAIAMPFGQIHHRTSQLIWIGLGLLFVLLGSDRLYCLYGGDPATRWISWLLALTFMPTLFVLNSGQIGPWIFLGSVLFLVCVGRGWYAAAGMAAALLAIKPHLLYLFWIVLIGWGVMRKPRLLIGGAIAGLVASGAALVFNPRVFQQWFEAMTQRPPVEWKSLTLGSLIREFGGEQNFALTFLPTLLGFAWLAWHLRSRRNEPWDWKERLPILFLVSFVTSSYGAWPFDLVILLPAVMHVAARLRDRPEVIQGALFWIALNGAALAMNLLKIGSFYFIWMAPTLLLAYCWFMRKQRRCVPHSFQ